MRAARAIVVLVALVVPLATAVGAAAAVEPGVTLDPDSPAGKEYALPLDVSRAAAVGRDAVQGKAQPLFGVGIRRAGARTADRSGGSGATGSGSRSGSRSGGTSRARPAGGAPSSRRGATAPQGAALLELSRPGSTTTEVGLIILAVVLGGLAVGAGIAVAARRRT